MTFRSVCLALLFTAASSAALAQGAQNPYGAQNQNGAPNPYGAPNTGQTPNPARQQPYYPPTPLPVPPMNQAPPTAPTPLRFVDPPGYGWCRYTDDNDKKTFYSAPFSGAPKHDVTPRDVAFADYIHRAYPGSPGAVDCTWTAFDSAYDAQVTEEQNESADQLRNYKMTNTQWKPPVL